MKSLSYLLLVLILTGCSQFRTSHSKTFIYTSNFHSASIKKPFSDKSFRISLPRGYKVENEDFNSEYKEIRFLYKDSTVVYITDDTFGGSAINSDNKLRNGIDVMKRKNLQDSVYMDGIQADGRHWKEVLLNDIVVGFMNVPTERKEEFDAVISSLKLVK